MHHGQLVHLQVEANAQLPSEVSDVLYGLASDLLLGKRGALDLLLLCKAIDPDENMLASYKHEFEIDILGLSISDTEA